MTQSAFIQFTLQLADALGVDIKAIRTQIGNMLGLRTQHKTTLVGAINEVDVKVDTLGGLRLEADQANSRLLLKDGNGTVLSILDVAFLNNEGTTFNLNQATGRIELLNDQGQVLSSADLQSFIKNMIVNAAFNNVTKYQLEFFQADGSTAFTVPFKIENIQGLQNALDVLTNKIGNLPSLTTTHKTDLVGAINEVNGKSPIKIKKRINLEVGYNQDTWYPVVATVGMPYLRLVRIRVETTLGNSGVPSWATHGAGFTVDFELETIANGWGTTGAQTRLIRNNFSYVQEHLDNRFPVGYRQMNNASLPVLYLRGGGSYDIITDYETGWSVKTSAFTASNETVDVENYRVILYGNNVVYHGIKDNYISTYDYGDATLWYQAYQALGDFVKKDGSSTMSSFLKFNNGWSSGGDANVTSLYRFYNNGVSKVAFNTNSDVETENFGAASQWFDIVTKGLGNGSTNIAPGNTIKSLRNENGNGGNKPYVPVLHLGANDTAWQIDVDYGTTTGELRYRSGYGGNYGNWERVTKSWDNVTAIGFANGSFSGLPYFYHKTGGFKYIATIEYINAQNYASVTYVDAKVAAIPIHNGQLTVNTTADLVGGYTYLPSGNITTTLGLSTNVQNLIANGATAYSWGNHANAGYTTLSAVQTWVNNQNFAKANQIGNGLVVIQGVGGLTGTATFSMNQSNNVVGSFDLTPATKNDIAVGVNAGNLLQNWGVELMQLAGQFNHIKPQVKQTIVWMADWGMNFDVEDGVMEGDQLSFCYAGTTAEYVLNGNIMAINLNKNSLFWWSTQHNMWIQAV